MHLKYIVLLTLFFLSLSAEQTQSLKIVNPSNAQISEENVISFIVEVNSTAIDFVMITTDTNETFRIKINPNRSHYCKTVNLHLGENNVIVGGYKKGILTRQEKKMVFLTSKVDKEYRYPPQEYSTNYFHNNTNEKVCASCHDMSVNEVAGVAFEDITKSNCYQCHSSIATKKHAHAPAVNWLCTSCHNGKVGALNPSDNKKTKYSVPDPIETVCFSCHEKNKDKWNAKRFHHEPADSGRCNKCHSPHSEENKLYLRKPVWELCTGCHKDKIAGMHIVKTFASVMHPTHNKKDPSRPGEDLSCVSCHNPHASNASSLLQSNSASGLCRRCHKK